jgi:hypothetical protein
VSELCRPSDRRLSGKSVPTFEDKGCHVVSVKDPYGRILDFLDRMQRLGKLYLSLVARQQLVKDIPMAMKIVGVHTFCGPQCHI